MSKLRSYRVSVVRWDVHDIWLEAPDAEAAEELARKRWYEGDGDDFRWRAGEIESVETEEVAP